VVATKLADAVEAGTGQHVLDLCTGHGAVAAALLERGASVTGLDFSAAMIALAREKAPEAHFLQGDAMAMEFSDACFDAVTVGFGVPHFPDPARGLAEAARILKPGGRLAFSIWCGRESDGAFGWLFDAVGRFGDPTVTLPEGPDAHLLAARSVAAAMTEEAGFGGFQFTEVASEFLVPEAEMLFDIFYQGAVRAASLLGGQPEAQRRSIRAALAERVRSQGRKQPQGYLVPAPSVIITAVRV